MPKFTQYLEINNQNHLPEQAIFNLSSHYSKSKLRETNQMATAGRDVQQSVLFLTYAVLRFLNNTGVGVVSSIMP